VPPHEPTGQPHRDAETATVRAARHPAMPQADHTGRLLAETPMARATRRLRQAEAGWLAEALRPRGGGRTGG